MPDPATLRQLALEMHGHADAVLYDCRLTPACDRCDLIAGTYRSLAHDFHQRATKREVPHGERI